MEENKIEVPKGFKRLKKVSWLVKDKEKGNYHLFFDGKVSKHTVDTFNIPSLKKVGEERVELIGKAVRRLLRGSEELIGHFIDALTSKVVDEHKFDAMFNDDYDGKTALKKATINTYDLTEDGFLITYVGVGLADKKWSLNKKGERVLEDRFPVKKSIDPFSAVIDTNVQFPKDHKEYFFVHDGHIFQLDWLIGHAEEEDVFLSFTGVSNHVVNRQGLFITTIVDPANIVEIGTRVVEFTKGYTVDVVGGDFDIDKPKVDIKEYVVRCDEEWADEKEDITSTAKEMYNSLTDFDVN